MLMKTEGIRMSNNNSRPSDYFLICTNPEPKKSVKCVEYVILGIRRFSISFTHSLTLVKCSRHRSPSYREYPREDKVSAIRELIICWRKKTINK